MARFHALSCELNFFLRPEFPFTHLTTVQFVDMKFLFQEFYEICLRCYISSSVV